MAGKKKIDLNNLTPDEVLKYEIAGELGLLDRVLENGWRTLTAKETDRRSGDQKKERDGEPGRNRCRFRNTSGKK